ncbi:MAG: PilZ domain-containing protein [Qipengyuania sp.]
MKHEAVDTYNACELGREGEQREAKRFTSLIRSAKLVSTQGEFVCVVRDVASKGISIRTFHDLPPDRHVALELQNGEIFELERVRAEGRVASYTFDAPVAIERLLHESWDHPKRQLRLNLAIPLVLSTLAGRVEGITQNLSQQGACVECDAGFAIDQTLRIEARHMPEIRAKVRWRRDMHYGLVFDNTFTLRDFALLAARLQSPALVSPDLS